VSSRAVTRLLGALVAGLAAAATLLGGAPSAQAAPAHPLGNFTVNHYDGLSLSAGRVEDFAVIDAAEIPTLQAKAAVDANGDGQVSAAERAAYAGKRCRALASALVLDVAGGRPTFTVEGADFGYRPGAAGLQTSRLTCHLGASMGSPQPTSVSFRDDFDGAGVGWHEVTAVASGVALVDSPLPAKSISQTLLRYPNDLLSSPLDVRGATLHLRPDGGSTYGGGFHVSGSNVFARAVNGLNTTFNGFAGRQHLTLGVGLLAVLLAVLLGAGHALLPGHGKTIMAAYLVGRRGRLRDVVTVGATVTLTHTAGVLLLGLVISLSATFAPSAAEKYLGVGSGALVALVGVGLLVTALRRRREAGGHSPLERSAVIPELARSGALVATAAASHRTPVNAVVPDHDAPLVGAHPHAHPHADEHDHPHGVSGWFGGAHSHGPDGHSHGPAGHSHGPAGQSHGPTGQSHGPTGQSHGPTGHGPAGHGPTVHDHASPGGHRTSNDRPFGRGGLVGLGIAGGLVPSPSALVVLLGAIGLGRTVFGVLLVLAYGAGLALTLTAAGLLLVPLARRAQGITAHPRLQRAARLVEALPVATAALVVMVGIGLAVRSLTAY